MSPHLLLLEVRLRGMWGREETLNHANEGGESATSLTFNDPLKGEGGVIVTLVKLRSPEDEGTS